MREWIIANIESEDEAIDGSMMELRRREEKESMVLWKRKRKRERKERYRFVGCIDASGIIYDVQRQYISEITIEPLLSAIKNIFSTFIRQINLEALECVPPIGSASRKCIFRVHQSIQDQRPHMKKSCRYPITVFGDVRRMKSYFGCPISEQLSVKK